jgi:putative membrane protein
MSNDKSKLILRDLLAVDRTKLANERTFLSYFRSFIVIVSSGIAIIKIDFLEEIQNLGWAFIFIGPALLVVGIFRFFYVRKKIDQYYTFEEPKE